MRYFFYFVCSLSLSGCVSYSNPMAMASKEKNGVLVKNAVIRDTVVADSATRANIFYLYKVNGEEIQNSLNMTSRGNYGKGMNVEPVATRRPVPANRELSIEICAETYNGAPILDLFRTDAKVCEIKIVTLAESAIYSIRGEIDGKSATVRIEESND